MEHKESQRRSEIRSFKMDLIPCWRRTIPLKQTTEDAVNVCHARSFDIGTMKNKQYITSTHSLPINLNPNHYITTISRLYAPYRSLPFNQSMHSIHSSVFNQSMHPINTWPLSEYFIVRICVCCS